MQVETSVGPPDQVSESSHPVVSIQLPFRKRQTKPAPNKVGIIATLATAAFASCLVALFQPGVMVPLTIIIVIIAVVIIAAMFKLE